MEFDFFQAMRNPPENRLIQSNNSVRNLVNKSIAILNASYGQYYINIEPFLFASDGGKLDKVDEDATYGVFRVQHKLEVNIYEVIHQVSDNEIIAHKGLMLEIAVPGPDSNIIVELSDNVFQSQNILLGIENFSIHNFTLGAKEVVQLEPLNANPQIMTRPTILGSGTLWIMGDYQKIKTASVKCKLSQPFEELNQQHIGKTASVVSVKEFFQALGLSVDG